MHEWAMLSLFRLSRVSGPCRVIRANGGGNMSRIPTFHFRVLHFSWHRGCAHIPLQAPLLARNLIMAPAHDV